VTHSIHFEVTLERVLGPAPAPRIRMSALQATRISPRSAAHAGTRAQLPLAGGWARQGAGEPPVIALVKDHLNSAVVAGTLLLVALGFGHRIGGEMLAAAAIAYAMAHQFMTKPRLDRADDDVDWGRVLRHRAIEWACIGALLLLAGHLLEVVGHFPPKVLLAWFIGTPFTLAAAHAAARKATRMMMRRAVTRRRQVIVGANRIGRELAARLEEEPWLGGLAGYFDDRRVERLPRECRPRLLGSFADLPDYLRGNTVHVIYVCLPISRRPRIRRLLDALGDTTASIYFVPDLSGFDLMQARFGEIQGMPLVAVRETPFYGMAGVLKRASDLALATAALPVILPLAAAIAILVRRSSPGPVLFRQRRCGLDGCEFTVYKFRTMTVCEDGDIRQASREDPRVTRVGRFLRRTSLDELPQLLNVFAGSMSLVGPRPHAVAHNEYYRKLVSGYMLRHKVRPGITGLAQVNGLRGETRELEKMIQRVRYDVEYLKNWSLGLDVRILIKTLRIVLTDRNAF
jgi:putative colanic acid biosynthesis UDP-glucose lipid carrier transferase